MLQFLSSERASLESRFTYSLALSPENTTETPRVREFTNGLTEIGLTKPVEYITREQALDREIQNYPAITGILSGENPFPDMIVIPLQGINTDMLWTHIQSYRDLFDASSDSVSLRMRLAQFDKSLVEIHNAWIILLIFLSLTGVLMLMVLWAIIRYHLRLFQNERVVGRLVGADPIFIWWPHAITTVFYVVASTWLALGFFEVFERLIG